MLPECKEISLPVDKSNEEVIQLLKSKIDQGIYSLGQLIVQDIDKKWKNYY